MVTFSQRYRNPRKFCYDLLDIIIIIIIVVIKHINAVPEYFMTVFITVFVTVFERLLTTSIS